MHVSAHPDSAQFQMCSFKMWGKTFYTHTFKKKSVESAFIAMWNDRPTKQTYKPFYLYQMHKDLCEQNFLLFSLFTYIDHDFKIYAGNYISCAANVFNRMKWHKICHRKHLNENTFDQPAEYRYWCYGKSGIERKTTFHIYINNVIIWSYNKKKKLSIRSAVRTWNANFGSLDHLW